MFRLLYLTMVAICLLPLVPGVLGLVFSSFHYLPPIGFESPSFDAFKQVTQWPGVEKSILLTIVTSVFSTILATSITFLILRASWHSSKWQRIELWLSPLLSLPHVAFAIGFAFLFTPTGLIARLIAFILDDPSISQWSLINDQYGIGLIIALSIKEVPFLLLMSIPVLKQLNVQQTLITANSLGYNTKQTWMTIILPQWLPKIRFPLYAVMAYSMSVVDVALILGPTNPPTFAVLVWQWFNDPDLNFLPRAAAGAMILFLLCSLLLMLIRAFEFLFTKLWRKWQYNGHHSLHWPGTGLFSLIAIIPLLTLPLMLVWSFALRWRFPDLMPSRFSLRFWQQEWEFIQSVIFISLNIGLLSGSIALLLALIAHEYHQKHKIRVPNFIIALPMLAPQLSILFGIQIATILVPGEHYSLWVIWAHVLFAFPYIYLALDGPWRSFDIRYEMTALSLGMSPLKVWWKIKRPILMPAIWLAWAVGISVSLTQYLPTLMLGAGRISTLTTEAVALASGQDRRVSALYALWQAALPLAFFVFALAASRLAQVDRVGLKTSSPRSTLVDESVHKKSHNL
ncbi:thiamine ABC transporter permease [Vibrio sp. Of7-15]|uniref:ABC transporter permease n=1 Tax=Vibrio sp. Of7-15 TaxID=2724879 RepID=UPI001EF2EB85|nr:thiamine ABC transporter permease [Vibrio sp. Of7-15]MCG7497680.1 thiamine ABC transporter permease [Vibrio sp. Of7-15]